MLALVAAHLAVAALLPLLRRAAYRSGAVRRDVLVVDDLGDRLSDEDANGR